MTRRTRASRLRLAAVAALTAALALAGCATIPRSGAVKPGISVQQQENGLGPIDFIPAGPATGATQQEILRGFIEAAVSPQGSYQIARSYLSNGFAGSWDPDASVTIDTGQDREDAAVDKTDRTLSISPVAYVDGDGNYRPAEATTPVEQKYTFVKEKGQWRISKAPDGIVIDSLRFADVFSPHPLYFYSTDYRYLVPDLRWFPTSPTSTRTRIVKELLAGPAKWLKEAYATAAPSGSKLVVDSVPQTSGVAEVNLNSTTGAADPLMLERFKLQLSKSLATALSISDVRILIEGVERQVPELGARAPIVDPQVDAAPLVVRSGQFGLLSGASVTAIPGVSGQVESLSPRAVTLSADRTTAAVLGTSAVYAVRTGADSPQRIDDRDGVLAPTLDPSGYVWSAASSDQGDLVVASPAGAVGTIPVAWPGGSQLRQVAMSRDGTRLAALLVVDGKLHVYAAGIARDDNGKPARVSQPVDFGEVSGGKTGALTWFDESTLGVLAVQQNGDSVVTTQPLGGVPSTTTGPGGARDLAAGNAAIDFWVLTSGGSLQSPRGSGWQEKANGIAVLGTQLGQPD